MGLEDSIPAPWGWQPPSLSSLRTQLNFTVAIDFTASNGECSGCKGGSLSARLWGWLWGGC